MARPLTPAVVAVRFGTDLTMLVKPESVATSKVYEVVLLPAVQVKVGAVATPVAPFAGPLRVAAVGAPVVTVRPAAVE